MPEWLKSGTRRDLCVLLYGASVRRQDLKSRLQRRYGRNVRPKQFAGALEALERSGHVERRVEGIHDVYALTDAGEAGVEAQHEWLRERVREAGDGGDATGGDGDGGTVGGESDAP